MNLFTPDNFRDDWYGYLTNQISHVAIGVFFTWGVCVFCLMVAGEFPFKLHTFLALAGLYLLYELLFQGWQGFDTIEDWMFFSLYGAGGTVLTFNEYDPGSALATFDIQAPSIVFPTLTIHLLIGCTVRAWSAKNER